MPFVWKRFVFLTASLAVLVVTGFSGEAEAAGKKDEYCREYVRTITIGNRTEEGYGTACLQPDGSWEIRNEYQQPVFSPAPQRIQTVIEKEVVYVNPRYYPRRVFYREKPHDRYKHRSRYQNTHFHKNRHDKDRDGGLYIRFLY
ncbi:MAG: hypothetical protein H6853_05580 [Rhodospirillales bacterium]|nr:hypothetical protein [Alphaproteobacteria bacterium]USO03019.1 MAG: hypothetical protein H6853_05580 [Rhodospirillales bacterium]